MLLSIDSSFSSQGEKKETEYKYLCLCVRHAVYFLCCIFHKGPSNCLAENNIGESKIEIEYIILSLVTSAFRNQMAEAYIPFSQDCPFGSEWSSSC